MYVSLYVTYVLATHKSLLELVMKLAQRQWEGSFRKPARQYGMSLTRKDSLKHQPPRKNGWILL